MSNATYKQDLHDIAIAVAQNSKNYTDKVADDLKWELGTYDLSVDSDTTSAYQKNVPANSIEAKINTLGCMSYKCNNLYSGEQNKTITITNSYYEDSKLLDNFKSGTTYTLSFDYKQVSGDTNEYYLSLGYGNTDYEVDANIGTVSLANGKITTTFTPNNTNYSNLYIRIPRYSTTFSGVFSLDNIMLNEGSTALPFEPYYSGFRDIAITSVKSVGFNQFNAVGRTAGTYDSSNPSFSDEKYYGAFSLNGQYYASGTVTLTSTSEGNVVVSVVNAGYGVGFPIKVIAEQTYHIDFNASNANINVGYFFVDYSGNITNGSYSNIPYNVNIPNNCEYLVLVFGANVTGTHTFSNINVNISNASLNGTYKPYFTASLLIPAQVQALDGYGWGINSTCYNYVDFNAKKFIKKANKSNPSQVTIDDVMLDDFYTNLVGNNIYSFLKFSDSKAYGIWSAGNAKCDKYEIKNFDSTITNTSYIIGDANVNRFLILLPNKTLAEAKTIIASLTFVYELATPVETDISAYLTTNKITVEGGGTLTAENTYGASVPSDIDYLKEVAK